MKKIILGALLIITVFVFLGCSAKKQFTITIETNPTTGFDYVCAIEGDSIQCINERIINSNNNPAIVGASSMKEYTFEVVKEGNSTIDLNYKRNWEGGEDAWHIYYEIEVDDKGVAKLYDKNVQDVDLHFDEAKAPDPVF